jgi:small-conductance mechanosensitive channel
MKSLLGIIFVAVFLVAADKPAILEFEGQTLFEFKSRVGSVSPSERVQLIQARLDRLLDDPQFDLSLIAVHEEKDVGWSIMADDKLLMVVTFEDAKLDEKPGNLVAQSIAFRLKEILEADRFAKSPRELMFRSLYAVLFTLGLLGLLLAMRLIHRRLLKAIRTWQDSLVHSVNIKTLEILPAHRIAHYLAGLIGIARLLLTLILFYFYLPLVLGLFPWTARLSPILYGFVASPLRKIFNGFVDFIPSLFFIVITIIVTRYILKFVKMFFSEIEKGRLQFSGFHPEWAPPTYQLVRILAIAFSMVMIFPYIPGSSSAAFQGVSVFLGVLVSLGSSSAMANIIAGLVLTYMRSFRIGDRVKIAESTGDVTEKSLLATRIMTVKNVEVTIPNAMVLAGHIINYSASAATKGLVLHTSVTIGYDAPWRKVHELLINAALRTEGIENNPAPFVLQTGLEDSYVRYEINAYTHVANRMASTYGLLHQNIQDAFNEAGLEIMSPSFSAIRDGNTVTTPPEHRAADYTPPSFRVECSKTDS